MFRFKGEHPEIEVLGMKKIEKIVVTKEMVRDRKGFVGEDAENVHDILVDWEQSKPFVSKIGAKWIGKKRKLLIGDLEGKEKLAKIAEKTNARGGVCKVLIEKGEMVREEYKKFNRWGDIRWLKEFIDEDMRDGVVYYVLKPHLR